MTTIISFAVYGAVYLLEVAILFSITRRRLWRRDAPILAYVTSFLLIDGVGRSYVLHRFGMQSRQYAYFYWLSDVFLTLVAFLLICALFWRASSSRPRLWRFLRLFLVTVFVLILGISCLSLTSNYKNLFSLFIVEFQQNLYFTCLVVNTLLYLLVQRMASADEELNLLVCGLGLQLAGPAANLALMFLTRGQIHSGSLFVYLSPLCALAMFVTWLYAVRRAPQAVPASVVGQAVRQLAEAPVRRASRI